jgi:RNA polymerase sigma-70 factor (ECF subfamily)
MSEDDESAFTEIYNRYWEKLLAISFFHAGVKQTAEDIVHDVMLSLWKRRKQVEITSLEAYLGTAVKFAVFKNIAREQRHRQLSSGQQQPAFTDDIESKLDAKFLEAYLNGEIEKLPAKARIIFHYSRSQQLKVSEITAKTDITPKAVEYHITRALRLLRESLKKIKSVFI